MKSALVVVCSGDAYVRYAEDLFDSAREFFRPNREKADCIMLDGPSGWPTATLFRWHVCLRNWPHLQRYDNLWLSDADMLFETYCGDEALAPKDGTVATLHPGYIQKNHYELPYETRIDSSCHILSKDGDVYYAGGFAGGDRGGFHWLASRIKERIDEDHYRAITPRFHDESALNKVLLLTPPDVILSPAWCHPDNDSYYLSFWPETYERLLVALDKRDEERGQRGC